VSEEFVARVRFIHDTARDISRDNLKNWKAWPGSAELRVFALQDDLDNVIARLSALIEGDGRPFDGPEFEAWRASQRSASTGASREGRSREEDGGRNA
jgi:hypothetical protein